MKKSLDPKQGLAKSVNTKWHASPVQNEGEVNNFRKKTAYRQEITPYLDTFQGVPNTKKSLDPKQDLPNL